MVIGTDKQHPGDQDQEMFIWIIFEGNDNVFYSLVLRTYFAICQHICQNLTFYLFSTQSKSVTAFTAYCQDEN